jgi:hypothetical protein|tara:strand:+ start:147 stop:374 length:228 start_codon:yes stop_codon:yes gene_type:complete
MNITQEFEVNDQIFTVEAYINPEVSDSWDDIGSPATIDIFTVYDEQGCEITSALDYVVYWELEDLILEYYDRVTD